MLYAFLKEKYVNAFLSCYTSCMTFSYMQQLVLTLSPSPEEEALQYLRIICHPVIIAVWIQTFSDGRKSSESFLKFSRGHNSNVLGASTVSAYPHLPSRSHYLYDECNWNFCTVWGLFCEFVILTQNTHFLLIKAFNVRGFFFFFFLPGYPVLKSCRA